MKEQGKSLLVKSTVLFSLAILCIGSLILLYGLALQPEQPSEERVSESLVSSQPMTVSVSEPTLPERQPLRIHQVVKGDTISGIARQYTLDEESLYGANPTLTPQIYPGDRIVILPGKGVLHKVAEGECLWQVANLYGVPVEEILKANSKREDLVKDGEELFVPGAARTLGREQPPVSRQGRQRFIWPTQGVISSEFGYRWGRLHAGVDIANDEGTEVRAALKGRISYADWCSGYGLTVVVEHESGYHTLYGHLMKILVDSGQYVRAGQRIGYMGNTGNSTGPHLHFEICQGGVPLNPRLFLPDSL